MDDSPSHDDGAARPEAERVFEDYLARVGRGEAVDFDALCDQHQEVAGTLRRMKELFSAVGGPVNAAQPGGGVLFQTRDREPTPSQGPWHVAPGQTLGDFVLVQRLGRGGMGEVWEAEQRTLSRRVALKLLLPERVDSRGLDFFAREARAGGRRAHPGSVSVHGTGEDDGLHWIAMELVAESCDLRRSLDALDKQDELPPDYYRHVAEFVAAIADALAAAHGAGVIHRDLKPGNILVTRDGKPKISDFGLAKLTDEQSLSLVGDLAGTYFYMSPEQVAAKRAGLDHRTDIFSLGVVLYEMLTLVRPFDGDTTEQVARKILWEDPPDPQKLRSRIPRDLAVICAKAMEKEPARRYQSMAELAADLRRHLSGEPILARPSGPMVRFAKWARRNPTKSVVAVVTAAALVVISAVAWQLDISVGEADRARAEAERVADFQSRMLRGLDAFEVGRTMLDNFEERIALRLGKSSASESEVADEVAKFRSLALQAPPVGVARDLLHEAILSPAAGVIEDEFGDDPRVEATLRQALAIVYRKLALYGQAVEQQERALSLRRQVLGDEDVATLESMDVMADLRNKQGNRAEASSLHGETLEIRRRVLGDENKYTLGSMVNLAKSLRMSGKFSEATALLREVMATAGRVLGESDSVTLMAMMRLAHMLERQGEIEEAGNLHRQALEANRGLHGDLHSDSLSALHNLGRWELMYGEPSAAEAAFGEALAGTRELRGDDHPDTLNAMMGVAAVLGKQQRNEEALELSRETTRISRRIYGNDHARTMRCLMHEGVALLQMNEFSASEPLLRQVAEFFRHDLASQGDLGTAHLLQAVLHNLALLCMHQDRLAEAENLFRELLELTPADHPSHAALKKELDAVIARRKSREDAPDKDR